jgi:hypothetical protein
MIRRSDKPRFVTPKALQPDGACCSVRGISTGSTISSSAKLRDLVPSPLREKVRMRGNLYSLAPKLCLGTLFCKLELALSVPNLEIGN